MTWLVTAQRNHSSEVTTRYKVTTCWNRNGSTRACHREPWDKPPLGPFRARTRKPASARPKYILTSKITLAETLRAFKTKRGLNLLRDLPVVIGTTPTDPRGDTEWALDTASPP